MNTSLLVGLILILGALVDAAVVAFFVAPRVKEPAQRKLVIAIGCMGALVMAGFGLAFLLGAFE